MKLETAVVFSLCQPCLACEFSKVHEAIEFIAGQSVWTHSIPRVMKGIEPSLRSQFSWAFSEDAIAANKAIADFVDAHGSNLDREAISDFINEEMGKLSEKFGETHEAREIDDPTSVYRNPLTEAEEIFGDKVINVEVPRND